ESANENLDNKVNMLIKDALHVNNTTVLRTERKKFDNSPKPGVVIATFRSIDDKQRVMDKKASLKCNRQYDRVFIHHDQSREERLALNNFRTVIDAMNSNERISIHGNRVVRNNDNNRGNNNRHRADNDRRDHVNGPPNSNRNSSTGARSGSGDTRPSHGDHANGPPNNNRNSSTGARSGSGDTRPSHDAPDRNEWSQVRRGGRGGRGNGTRGGSRGRRGGN
ncbi:MAG: hypothetical protein ABW185_16360, partial [Sedimenticola sp.]